METDQDYSTEEFQLQEQHLTPFATEKDDQEKKLVESLKKDTANWVEQYKILKMFKENEKELKEITKMSFTGWVNHVAEMARVHVSLIWRRLKAGTFYEEYQKRNPDAPALEKSNLSAESLQLLAQISGKRKSDLADPYVEKLARGECTKSELSNLYSTVKSQRNQGHQATQENSNLGSDCQEPDQAQNPNHATAAKVLLAIQRSAFFKTLMTDEQTDIQRQKIQKGRLIDSYVAEFPVHTGDTRHAQRIDLMVVENYTTDGFLKPYDVALHGIEIKVAFHDLINDHKKSNYVPFCDYCWLGIPDDDEGQRMLQDIEKPENAEIYKHFGVLLVNLEPDHQDVKIHRLPPDRTEPQGLMRHISLSEAIIKLANLVQ